MRAPILFSLSLVTSGALLACGALTGVDWDRVSVQGSSGGASGASGTSGTSGASGGTSGSSGASGNPAGSCTGEDVECLSADGVKCCPNGGDPGLPVTLAAGGQNTCAIAASGQVKCWGGNGAGQLGRGNVALSASTPQLVFRIPKGATQISVGDSYVCAIVDSLFTCWGSNTSGQFGNGSTDNTTLPVVIPLAGVPDAIGAGSATTCASVGGAGLCWGANSASQAGNETEQLRVIAPGPVKGLPALAPGALVIAARHEHACASGATQLFCWGTNSSNRLGSSGPTQSATALVVTNGLGPARITLGESHGCALHAGAVQCWGDNTLGELGNDSVSPVSNGAIAPTGLGSGVTSICAGTYHTCVIQSGVVKCFGDNSQGQSGIAPAAARVPSAVQGLTAGFAPKELACGQFHTCALSDAGAIKCWGQNGSGQLGDGSSDMKSSTPRDVKW
ncbi:hypothetical protein BH11MYX4_BH11MYX4_67700 [soil metagenome]